MSLNWDEKGISQKTEAERKNRKVDSLFEIQTACRLSILYK
jgi:hypothetical protein